MELCFLNFCGNPDFLPDRGEAVVYSTNVDFYCLLICCFANSLDPDQARQNVRPDLGSYYLTI